VCSSPPKIQPAFSSYTGTIRSCARAMSSLITCLSCVSDGPERTCNHEQSLKTGPQTHKQRQIACELTPSVSTRSTRSAVARSFGFSVNVMDTDFWFAIPD
jgi:hypothetical protein